MSRGIVGAPARYQDVAGHHAPRPVIAVAGEGTDLAAINDDQVAAAVIFDFVNPSESYLSRNIVGFGRSEGLDGSRAAKTKVP